MIDALIVAGVALVAVAIAIWTLTGIEDRARDEDNDHAV